MRCKNFTDGNSRLSRQKTIEIQKGEACQLIVNADSRSKDEVEDESIFLVVTLSPHFNSEKCSQPSDDLGNVHDLNAWLGEI